MLQGNAKAIHRHLRGCLLSLFMENWQFLKSDAKFTMNIDIKKWASTHCKDKNQIEAVLQVISNNHSYDNSGGNNVYSSKIASKSILEILISVHFQPLFYFYTPWKYQKTFGFLMFLGVIEVEHWLKMD